MRHFRCFCVWTLLSTLWTFLGVRVGQDYEPRTDFARYDSFGWAAGSPDDAVASRWGGPFVKKRVHDAVDGFLTGKGYAPSPEEKPDFLVDIHLTVVRMVAVDRAWEGGPGFRHLGDAAIETSIDEYDEGTLIIDFIDAETQKLFWRGTGTRRIDPSASPRQSVDTIDRWVSEILKQYPPQAKDVRRAPAGCSSPPKRIMPAAPQT